MIVHRKKARAANAKTKAWQESTKDWKARVRKEIRARDGHCCFYCAYPFSDEFPATLEHLLPIAAGGSDHVSNLVLACDPCNKKVGDWPLIRKIKYREYRLLTKL